MRKQEVERDLLSRRVKSHPEDSEAHFAMGDHLLKVRDYGGAKREFLKAVDLKPKDPRVHERLVTVVPHL